MAYCSENFLYHIGLVCPSLILFFLCFVPLTFWKLPFDNDVLRHEDHYHCIVNQFFECEVSRWSQTSKQSEVLFVFFSERV